MRRPPRPRRSHTLQPQHRRVRLQVELLETRNLLATSTFALTPLVEVSGDSPLPPFQNPDPPALPTVFNNSEVEPQIAVDPTNLTHAVAI